MLRRRIWRSPASTRGGFAANVSKLPGSHKAPYMIGGVSRPLRCFYKCELAFQEGPSNVSKRCDNASRQCGRVDLYSHRLASTGELLFPPIESAFLIADFISGKRDHLRQTLTDFFNPSQQSFEPTRK